MLHRYPLSTRAIQGARALNYSPDERWVDWAVRLLTEGADTPSLRIMAGLRPPFHYFEVTQLLDRTLDELGVPALVEGEAAGAYAHDVVGELVRSPESMNEVLAELNQLCIATGYCSTLRPFYLLHFARIDLAVRNCQYYWDGANRSNIDQIVRDEAKRWLDARTA